MKYCRNCGVQVNENADICTACGVAVGKGNKYCPNCGAATNEEQAVCLKCGVNLGKAKASNTTKGGSSNSIHRTDDGKLLGGVCAGLAKSANCNPWIIRAGWILLTMFTIGIGAIAYIAAIFLLPKE